MPIEVLLPDGSSRSFPNGTPEDEIRRQLLPAVTPAPDPVQTLREASGVPNPPSFFADTANRIRRAGAEGVANTVQGAIRMAGGLLDVPKPKETPYYEWATNLAEGAKEAFPTDPARDRNFLSTLLGGAGQMAPTVAAAMVGGPAAAAIQYGLSAGEQGAQEAEAAGRPDRADRAFYLNALAGALSEAALGVAPRFGKQLFGTAQDVAGDSVGLALKRAAEGAARDASKSIPRVIGEGAIREGAQEGLEQLAQNQIAARDFLAGYDPERPAMQGVLESMAAGGILGASVNAVASLPRLAEGGIRMPKLRVGEAPTPLERYAKLAEKEGLAAVVDFVQDPGRQVQQNGEVVAVSEADTDLGTGRVKVYLPEIQDSKHLRGIFREEKTHLWLNTVPEGKTAFQEYLEQHPVPPEVVGKLQAEGYLQGEASDTEYRARLTDEYLAKLSRDGWWSKTVGELTAVVKKSLGFDLTPEQAGRLLLRNARGWQAQPTGEPQVRDNPYAPALETAWKKDPAEAQRLADTLPEPTDAWRFKTSDAAYLAGVSSRDAEFTRSLTVRGKPLWKWINEVQTSPTSDIRESLRAVKPDEELTKLATEYPGVSFTQETRSGPSAKYDPETKQISLTPEYFQKMQWERDNEIKTSLMEAGVAQFTPKSLSEDIFYRLQKADPARVERTTRAMFGAAEPTEEIRQQVAAKILTEQIDDQRIGLGGKVLGTTTQIGYKLAGLTRLATRAGLSLAGHSGSRGVMAARNILQNMVERAALPKVQINKEDPEQTFADLHAHVGEVFGPGLRDLRSKAAEIENRSYERRQWRDLSRVVDALGQEVRVVAQAHPERLALLGEEGISLDPMEDNFIETAETVLGRPLSPEELSKLEDYRNERRARSIVSKLDDRDRLRVQILQAQLDGDNASIIRLTDELSGIEDALQKAKPQYRLRADEIRASDAMVPYARAAEAVLQKDPDISEWLEQFDRAGERTPQSDKDVTEPLLRARQALRDRAHVQSHARSQDAAIELGEFLLKTYGPAIRELTGRYAEQVREISTNQNAMSDLVLALAGEADNADTATGREAATALRELNSAVAGMALKMASAKSDTLLGQMREQLRLGQPGEPAFWLNLAVDQVAAEAKLGSEATRRILQLIARSPEFHNALFELHKNASGEASAAVVTALEQIKKALADAEQEGFKKELDKDYESKAKAYRQLAAKIADTKIDELAQINRGLQRDILSLERELAELEQKRLEKQFAADFFKSASEAFGELPNIRRMVYNTTDGRRIEGFKGKDGDVKGFTLRPGSNYPLSDLVNWLTQATEAVKLNTDDAQTIRGLGVGIQEVEKLVSERFTEDQIVKALAPSYPVEWLSRRGWFRTKGLLSRLVPGVWGANTQQSQQNWVDVHAKVEKLRIDEAARWDKLKRQAAKSLGLDPARRPGDAVTLNAVYNEVSNELRQHNSGVEEGDLIWATGTPLTPELLTWIQYDAKVLKKGQKIEQARPFGGVRENFPGRQVVRPPAPVGDIGLPRIADFQKVSKLRNVYAETPRTAGRYTDRSRIDQFWTQSPNALGSHIRAAKREDTAIARTPEMRAAEIKLENSISTGKTSLAGLRTVDDWAEAIRRFLPPGSRIDPAVELRNELDQYGAHAISREGGRESTTPTKSAVTLSGEDDTTAFTQPAARMFYPPSFYQYGTSQGLNRALEQLSDPVQKEYIESLIQARDHLTALASDIREAIPSKDFTKHAGLIRWALEGQLGKTFIKGSTTVTAEMAQQAADVLAARAGIIQSELTRITEPQQGSLLQRILQQIFPYMLLRPSVLAANVFGGPVAAFPVLSGFFGTTSGSLLTFGAFPFSAGSMLWNGAADLIRYTAKLAHVDLPQSELDAFLESYGIGASLNMELIGEGERASAGRLGLSGPAKALALARGAANEASQVIGVRAGDKYLNRAMSRSVIPAIFWRLKRTAAAWKARAETELAEGKTRELIDTTFSEEDSAQAPQIREFLTSFGKPEELLLQLQGVPLRRWFNNDLGKRIGYALLQELNVASPVNRPNRNTLLGLMGWTSKMVDGLTAMTRVTPETSTLDRLRRGFTFAVFGALAASTAYYFQVLGRQMINGGVVAGATAIANVLQGLPADQDDPNWLEMALNALAVLNGWLRKHSSMLAGLENVGARAMRSVAAVSQPSMKSLPYQPGFWERPWKEVAKDLVTAVPSGIGINQTQLPVLGIAEQFAASGLQIGRGAVTLAESPNDAGRAAALADLKAGTRNVASLFGLVGGAAMEFLVPGSETGRDTRSVVAAAANKEGVRMEAPFLSGALVASIPIRKELMAAGAALVKAQEEGDAGAIEAAQKKIDDLSQFVAERAAKRATELGQSPAEAKKAGESAVKKLMGQLDPIRYGIGRSVTKEELAKLESRVGQDAAVVRDRAAASAIVRRVAGRRRFKLTRGMTSPLRRMPRLSVGRRRKAFKVKL